MCSVGFFSMMELSFYISLLCFGIFSTISYAENHLAGIKVDRTEPRSGGVGGSVKITAYGKNFDTELDYTRNEPRTKMYLVSQFREYECDFHQAESDEHSAVCYTRPMEQGEYYLRMKVVDSWLQEGQYCFGRLNHKYCSFTAKTTNLPTIDRLSRTSSPPQSLISIRGKIFSDVIASSNATASNGRATTISRVWLTSGTCDLYRDVDDFYGLTLDHESSDWGDITCLMTSSYVGNQNASFIVKGEFGRSVEELDTRRVSADNRIYMLQTYALVDDVVPKSGSLLGGALLTVTGRFFDDNSGIRARVLVGGAECPVTDVTDERITCLLPPKSVGEAAVYPGGRGALVEYLTRDGATYGDREAEGYDRLFYDAVHVARDELSEAHEVRVAGFFVPSVTSPHRFYMTYGDDDDESCPSCRLYFAINQTLELIAEGDGWSEGLPLAVGHEYHYVMNATLLSAGSEPMALNAFVEKSAFTSAQIASVVDDRQHIYTRSTPVNEAQLIELEGWRNSSGTAQNTEIRVRLTCDPICYEGGSLFRLVVSGLATPWMERDLRESSVAANLAELSVFADAGEKVSAQLSKIDDNVTEHVITLESPRGNFFPYVTLETSPSLEGALELVQAGAGDRKTVTFAHGGILATPVPLGADPEMVEVAITELFEPKCPVELSRESLAPKAFRFYDMESDDGTPPGAQRSGVESFCGTYAARNLQTAFNDDKKMIRLNVYKHFCFAYVGQMRRNFRLHFNYKDGNQVRYREENFVFDGIEETETWRYMCYNLEAIVKARYDGFKDYRISKLNFQRHRFTAYVDDLFFGQVAPTEPEIRDLLEKRIPPAVPGIKLSDITVTVNASIPDTYQVTMTSHDCGFDYPLIGVAFLEGTERPSEDEAVYGTTSPRARVKRLSAASPPVGGTFDIAFEDDLLEPIGPVPANISAADLTDLMQSVDGISRVELYRWGRCSGLNWIFYTKSPGGRLPDVVVNGTGLTGVEPTVRVYRHATGGLKMAPIGGDFLRTAHEGVPQVQVFINGVPSSCAADYAKNGTASCGFLWSEDATPQVDTVTPGSGSRGIEVRLEGSGFDKETSGNRVTVGGVACQVTAASGTFITCLLGASPAGADQPVEVVVAGKGLSNFTDETQSLFTVTGRIDFVTPSNGSRAGCSEIAITGSGWPAADGTDAVTVTLGTAPCRVTSILEDVIRCVTSSSDGVTGPVDVVVTVVGTSQTISRPGGFEYLDSSDAGEITSLSTKVLSVAGDEELTIGGTGFGTVNGTVTIEDAIAPIMSWSDSAIVVWTPSLAPGMYWLQVQGGNGKGCAINSGDTQLITYGFSLDSISPKTGSIVGGTRVSVRGTGFSDDTRVMFGTRECQHVKVEPNKIVCISPPTTVQHRVDNMGSHPTYGIGYGWRPQVLTVRVGDEVAFVWATPTGLRGIEMGPFTVSDTLSEEYDGAGFQAPAAPSGTFTYRFTRAGTFHYKSVSRPNSYQTVTMPGRVLVVDDRDEIVSDVTATLAGHQADNPNALTFKAKSEKTPIIEDMSPLVIDVHTKLEIELSNANNVPTVTVGGRECPVSTESTTDLVVCQMSSDQLLGVGRHQVVVNVASEGNAMFAASNLENRSVIFHPTVESLTPTMGSQEGGTLLTIEGAGFSNATRVEIGTFLECRVVEASYARLICLTPPHPDDQDRTFGVTVRQRGVPANNTALAYAYLTAGTPLVRNLTVATNLTHYDLRFNGTGFGTDSANATISVGDAGTSCNITSMTEDAIQCQVGLLPVGSHPVELYIEDKGIAKIDSGSSSRMVESTAEIFSVDPQQGSLMGGTLVTIRGNGFFGDDTWVKFGGQPGCDVTSLQLDVITCVTRARWESNSNVQVRSGGVRYPEPFRFRFTSALTPLVILVSPSSAHGGEEIELIGSGFGNDTSLVTVTATSSDGEDVELCSVTRANHTHVTCTLNSFEGGPIDLKVHVSPVGYALVLAPFNYTLAVQSVRPRSGSFGGGQELTVTGHGFSNRSRVEMGGLECAVLSRGPSQIRCRTPAQPDNTTDALAARVVVSNGDTSSQDDVVYHYLLNQTAVVSGVTPARGGTGGGTVVTVSGAKFRMVESQEPTVVIGGVPCGVKTFTDTQIVCETEPRPEGTVDAQVEVFIGDYGIARQDSARFWYIDRWSSVFTWGGTPVPVEKDFVVIPKGKTVLLDAHTEVLVMLLIDGGKLIFDDSRDVSLHAENILITNGGVLQVGTEQEPYLGRAEIVLYGQLRSPELPIYGAKTLGVRDGVLDLHGRHIPYTWSVLDATAPKGSTQITIQHEVNWRVGDEIAIATTGHRHTQEQNEQRTITAISHDGKTLTLDEPLEFEHLGVEETFGSRTVQFRAEVGLLTRNIVVRGSDDPQWHDEIPRCEEGFDTGEFATQTCFQGRFGEEVGADQFGGSIMVHAREPSSGAAVARIEYVELYYMGQAFRLGRYPIHWHLMGDVSGMYVRGCAIHKTFNRAVAIHGTDNLLVDRNVIFDIMGGAFFIEDGIETGVVLQYNLAIFVRQSTSLLNDDVTPAAYWVTNPNNTVVHNRAAGGTHFGFWYRMHEHPDGPSFTSAVCQQKVELGEFRNNTVHSQGWFGLWIFQTYTPMVGSGCGGTVPAPARFHTLTAWNNEKGAEWVECGAMQFHDFVLVNNEVTGIDTKLVLGTGYGLERGAMISGALVVGHTALLSPPDFETEVGITLAFAPGLTVENVELYNFDRTGVAFKLTTIDGTCVELCGGFHYMMKGLSFTNVKRRVHWRWEHEAVLEDVDGSLTGKTGHRLVPRSGLVTSSSCEVLDGEVYSGGEVGSVLCAPDIRIHRFALNAISPSSMTTKDMIITNQHGNSSVPYAKKRLTHKAGWMALLYGGERHRVEWRDATQFTNISYNSKIYDLVEPDHVIISHRLASVPDVVDIGGNVGEVGDSVPLTGASGNLEWYFDLSTRELDYMVANRPAADTRRRKRANLEVVEEGILNQAVSPKIYRCKNLGCLPDLDGDQVPPSRETPEDAFTWSSLSLEGSGRRKRRSATAPHPCVLVTGGTVEILKEAEGVDVCWCLIDVPDVELDHLVVKGVVQFSPDVVFDHYRFSAFTIQVLGGRIIAGHLPEDPFLKKLTISLRGESGDGSEVNLDGVALGTKAIGCFGGCDFHGVKHNVYWTRLAETQEAGSNTIRLEQEVDWVAGDEIMIATTSYSLNHTELARIASVSGKQVTLTATLRHRHLGVTYTVNGTSFDMRAEVSLLTRNIKIEGQIYDAIDKDAFGARMVVGYLPSEDYYGWARLSNVEVVRGGQEGFTEPYDPRFALAWLNSGPVVPARPSYVRACTFHHSYSTGIGVFGADGIQIADSTVHRPVHDGIRIAGTNVALERNLVANAVFRGAYGDRFEDRNYVDWHASFKLTEGANITLVGNVAAGSERLGFHTNGVACDQPDAPRWTGNVAHGCLHGIHMYPGDAAMPCSLVENFVVYKSWDFGVYHQTPSSVTLRNLVIADSQVGYTPIVYDPPSLSHAYADKVARVEDLLLVGRSEDFDETVDTMDETTDKNLILRRIAGMKSKKAPATVTGGKIGVLLPMFMSGTNGCPDKSWIGNMNYPAIRGLLDIKGLIAHNYGIHGESRDLVFQTNAENEDAYAATHVAHTALVSVEPESLVVFHRPSLGKINPSDCVDMECDGMKNVFIKDTDGGLLGSPGAIIPDAAYGWDNDSMKARGLGDYRIPKTMLTRRDGTRIEVESIIDHRGIVGTDDCTYRAEWQAFECDGAGARDYAQMIVESMDADTELRRLSPLALMSDRYVDLENGPQDHGWCAGYTCQKRLSTFFTVVATASHYDVFFTGYPPLDLRIHLLNVDDSTTVRLGIYYPKPERLDVYNGDVLIHPNNQELDADGNFVTRSPHADRPDEYKPAINASIHGANYMDRRNDILYLTVRGTDPIDIRTAPAVIVKFGFPAVSVDDFFEENLVQNLADYLGVPPHKIKIVDIVRETPSRRKRRSSTGEHPRFRRAEGDETVTFVFEFDEGIVESADDNSTAPTNGTSDKSVLAEMINNKTSEMILDFQTGALSSKLNISSTEMVFEATVATMELPPAGNVTADDVKEDTSNVLLVPSRQVLKSSVSSVEELSDVTQLAALALLDRSGSEVSRLGGSWRAEMTIFPQSGVDARIIGSPSAQFVDGAAVFSGLAISEVGSHIIEIKIVEPSTINIAPVNMSVVVSGRQVAAHFLRRLDGFAQFNSSLDYTIHLMSGSDGSNLTHIGFKGNEWRAEIDLAHPTAFGADVTVEGAREFAFDNASGEARTDGMRLANASLYHRYMLRMRVYSTPAIYPQSLLVTPTFQLVPDRNSSLFVNATLQRAYKIAFGGSVANDGNRRRRRRRSLDGLTSDEAGQVFADSFSNFVVDSIDGSYVGHANATQAGNVTIVEFRIDSRDEVAAEGSEATVVDMFGNRTTARQFAFDGRSFAVAADQDCFLEVEGACRGKGGEIEEEPVTEDEDQRLATWQIVLVVFGCALVVTCITCVLVYQYKVNHQGVLRRSNSTSSDMPAVAHQATFAPSAGRSASLAARDEILKRQIKSCFGSTEPRTGLKGGGPGAHGAQPLLESGPNGSDAIGRPHQHHLRPQRREAMNRVAPSTRAACHQD